MRECVSGHMSWDWAVRSEETDVFVTLRGPVLLWQRRAGSWEGWGVYVGGEGIGGEKELLALRGWIYKDFSEEMMGPGGRRIRYEDGQ